MQFAESEPNYRGACHCGAIQFALFVEPQWLVSCNCSICSRLGALWAHIEDHEVVLQYAANSTIIYSWGEETLEFHTCRVCGCTTHWENTHAHSSSRMAVNFRMCPKESLENFDVRILDGADSWKFIAE